MIDLHIRQVFPRGISLCVAAGLLFGAGCGGSQKGPTQNAAMAGASNVSAPPPVDRSRCKSDGKQVIGADTDLDKKPDVWKYYVPNGKGAQVATCKQVDLNHDGKVDITYYFDDTGSQSALEEFDLDFDGRIDLTVYFANGKKVREELDMNYDNRSDVWKFYEDEKLVRIERDSDYNGKIDQWEFYESGKLDRIGYDTSGSGRVDKWDRAPEGTDDVSPTAPPAATPAPPVPAASTAAPAATAPSAPAAPPASAPATAAKK
jgi:hypothetical protein